MPRNVPSFTVKTAEAAKPHDRDYRLRADKGLTLRVYPNGRKAWEFRYRHDGRQRTIELAEFGDRAGQQGRLTLQEARDRAKELAQQVRAGLDPRAELVAAAAERVRERAAAAAADAARVRVAQVAERWYSGTIKPKFRRPEFVRALLDRHILPALGELAIADVKRGHVADLVEAIRDGGARRTADQVLGYCKRLFAYAVAKGHIDASPAVLIGRKELALGAKPRARNLRFVELRRFVRWIYSPECFAQGSVRALLKILVLTGCRTGEAIGAKWEHIDLDPGLWRVPPGDAERRAKSEREHLIHLSPQAIEVLKGVPRFKGTEWVFASPKRDKQAIDEKAAARVVRRAFDPAKRKRSKDWTPDPKAKRRSKLDAPAPLAGIAPFTPHDLRRTFRSRIADLGVLPHVGEKCINHELTGVLGVYDVGEYLPERKAAFELWGATVADLVADESGARAFALDNPEATNVVVLTRAA